MMSDKVFTYLYGTEQALIKYDVISIDAWANGDDWDYNDWHKCGIIEIKETFIDVDIIKLLIDEWFLIDMPIESYYAECFDGETITIYCKNSNKPIYDLIEAD